MGSVSLQETPQSSLAPSHMRTQWSSANQEEGPYRRQVCRPDPRTPPLQNCEEGTSVGRGPGLWYCYRSPNGPDGHLAAQTPSSLVSPRGHLDILVFFDNRTGRQLTHGAGPVVLGPPHREGGQGQEGLVYYGTGRVKERAGCQQLSRGKTRDRVSCSRHHGLAGGKGRLPSRQLRFWVTKKMDTHSQVDTRTGSTAQPSFVSWLHSE